MRNLKRFIAPNVTVRRKLIAITALAGVLAFGIGPIGARASAPSGPTPGDHACSDGGSFTISYENGAIVATDLNQDCAGTAVIPSGVTKIGLFRDNASLTGVEIPASVTEIVPLAFFSTGLTSAIIDANSLLTRIPQETFAYTGLTSFIVPKSVTSIGPQAFQAGSLRSISFASDSQLRAIEHYAFVYSGLTTISLPSSLVEIQSEAFWHSGSLRTVSFASDSKLSTIGSSAFGETSVSSLSLPTTPTRSGYTFLGWSNTQDGEPIANAVDAATSVLAGQDLFALWRGLTTVSAGSVPGSQVVSISAGLTAAEIPASANLPKVTLAFAATNSSASATVLPIANPAGASATPFAVTSATKIVDIQVAGITGPVTVCLDGASTDEIFHYTGGAWVSLPQRTFANGQVCGVTESFSPFAAAVPVPLVATAPVVQIAPYTGPRILGRVNKVAEPSGGTEVTIIGDRLSQVNSITLEGKELAIISKSETEIVVKAPAHATGFVDLLLKTDSVSLVFQEAIEYKAPVAARVPVTTSKNLVVANAAAKTLTSAQAKLLRSYVASANTGAVLNCQATYVSKADAAIAKALAADACATAKKSNPYLTTKVLAPVSVKAKTGRTVLLSLTR